MDRSRHHNVKGDHAVLFDLDGILVDTEILYVKAIERVLSDVGCLVSEKELLALIFGRSWHDISDDLRRIFTSQIPEDLTERVRHHHQILDRDGNTRIDSSVRLLINLAQRYPIAVVSGSPRREVEMYLRRLEVHNLVKFYLGAEDYRPGKPDPACYLLASDIMNVPPKGCLVFEDSSVGVMAAKRAGMFCVALQKPNYPKQDLSRADIVLSDLAEYSHMMWPTKIN